MDLDRINLGGQIIGEKVVAVAESPDKKWT